MRTNNVQCYTCNRLPHGLMFLISVRVFGTNFFFSQRFIVVELIQYKYLLRCRNCDPFFADANKNAEIALYFFFFNKKLQLCLLNINLRIFFKLFSSVSHL